MGVVEDFPREGFGRTDVEVELHVAVRSVGIRDGKGGCDAPWSTYYSMGSEHFGDHVWGCGCVGKGN